MTGRVRAGLQRPLTKAGHRLLTRAARKHGCEFVSTYRAATVRERKQRALFSSLLRPAAGFQPAFGLMCARG